MIAAVLVLFVFMLSMLSFAIVCGGKKGRPDFVQDIEDREQQEWVEEFEKTNALHLMTK